jgi:hypothetical protein
MNKIETRYMKIMVTTVILVFATSVQAQDDLDDEAYSAESSTSPEDQLLSPDTPIEETSDPSEGEDPLEERSDIGLVFGLKLGANFSQAFSDLGTSFVGELEIGYLLPLPDPIGKSIELFVTGQYTQPALEDTTGEPDPRLPGDGLMHYEITQQQVILTFGALYRIPIGGSVGEWLRPYGALGARLFMMRTQVEGSVDDEAFGENEETATEPGFYGALGGDIFLGPGSAFLEMQLSYASLDGYVMRDTNVGALNLAVGYRLFI